MKTTKKTNRRARTPASDRAVYYWVHDNRLGVPVREMVVLLGHNGRGESRIIPQGQSKAIVVCTCDVFPDLDAAGRDLRVRCMHKLRMIVDALSNA